jgi:hypothetical protein
MVNNLTYSFIGSILEIVIALFKGMDFARAGQLIKERIGNQTWSYLTDIMHTITAMGANTMHHKTFVDAFAFMAMVENQSGCESVELILPTNYRIKNEVCPIGGMVQARFSRYAMDGNGYHVGYEYYDVAWKLFDRKLLELDAGAYPWLVSRFAIIPDQMEILSIEPAMDQRELDNQCAECNAENADKNGELDCSTIECNQYYPPDEDFAYSHIMGPIEFGLDHGQLIEAEFTRYNVISKGEIHDSITADVQPRVWTIGDHEVDLDAITNEIQSGDYDPILWQQPNEPIDAIVIDTATYERLKGIIKTHYESPYADPNRESNLFNGMDEVFKQIDSDNQ